MHFRFHGLAEADFTAWVRKVQAGGAELTDSVYRLLERPSEDEPPRRYASVGANLYHKILNLCVDTGKMCMDEMMRVDSQGGLGLAGIRDEMPLEYDKYARRGAVLAPEQGFVASICDTAHAAPVDPKRLAGGGPQSAALLR
jgi:cytochrome o ubiquinol oxidase subunit 2